tara:strand:- start:3756 stop:4340 length:585 start_codon:yes stop_codon:yes gene_type:complete
MSNAYSYIFDNLSRIGNDECGVTARDTQNSAYGNYLTTNYFVANCGMKQPINFATKQPNVFYGGGVGSNCGAGGCVVSDETKLMVGNDPTRHRCKLSLQQRQFLTVPFLGRGPAKPVFESKIQQGAQITDKKSCRMLTEKCFMGYSNIPMIPSLNNTIQNPANLIEQVAADGWIRGGLPSRELTRDQDYLERNA